MCAAPKKGVGHVRHHHSRSRTHVTLPQTRDENDAACASTTPDQANWFHLHASHSTFLLNARAAGCQHARSECFE